jgi:hypothetical protein
MCHIIACLLNLLALIEINYIHNDRKNWYETDDVMESEWYEKYSYALYWATTTLMLTGGAKNSWIEASFTTLIYFIGIGIFGYLVKNVGELLDEMGEEKEHKRK